jgi:atlastin
MGSPDEPLTVFSWKPGVTRDTSGIVFWSDVFLQTTESGEKMAIFLVDSQGLFDTQMSPADNSRIFALTTLISLVQILNVKDNIQENQLEYLQVSTNLQNCNFCFDFVNFRDNCGKKHALFD